MSKRLLILLISTMMGMGTGYAQMVPDSHEGRLWRLCKVWGYMKYYSPRTCQIKWDSLANATIPMVLSTSSNAGFNDRIMEMLNYVGQIPPAMATPVPAADSNLNLQLEWTDDNIFSADVRNFLDTFERRAGRNDALSCRVKRNDYSDMGFYSYIDARNDEIDIPIQTSNESNRLTVLFQFWNAYQYFGPNRKLNNQPWDSTLLQAIAEVRAAATPAAFHFALIKAQSDIDDSHGIYSSAYYGDSVGSKYAGIMLSKMEEKTIVSKVHPDVTGIAVGDVVTKIDGIPVADVENSYRMHFASSNEATFYRDVYYRMARSHSSSKIFEFLNASGQPYTKTILYDLTSVMWNFWITEHDAKPVWSTLCNGYGYVNLGKLLRSQVAQMYEEMKYKEAIVFDVRNYPDGTLWYLAPLLFPGPVMSARYFVPDFTAPGRFIVDNDLNNLGNWNNSNPYPGKLYFLVNEQTQSQAEYTVQYLSHFPNAKVVGSQTAGADGNIVYFKYPGLTFNFTGLGWYYDDWYQCQRNGIKIDEVVTPTIQGFKEGRDELLEHVSGCFNSVIGREAAFLQVTLYPNPATDRLGICIKCSQEDRAAISITDAMGRMLYIQSGRRVGPMLVRDEADISSLSTGIYFVKVSTASGASKTLKLVKR